MNVYPVQIINNAKLTCILEYHFLFQNTMYIDNDALSQYIILIKSATFYYDSNLDALIPLVVMDTVN